MFRNAGKNLKFFTFLLKNLIFVARSAVFTIDTSPIQTQNIKRTYVSKEVKPSRIAYLIRSAKLSISNFFMIRRR